MKWSVTEGMTLFLQGMGYHGKELERLVEEGVKIIEQKSLEELKKKGIRPTPVNRDVYIAFGDKCRSNDCEINDVLTDIMQKYIDEN